MINRWHLVSHCLITFFISKKCFQFQTEQCFNVNVKRKHKKQQKIHSLSLNELSIYLFALHWKSARCFISRGINHRVSHSLCALPCKQPPSCMEMRSMFNHKTGSSYVSFWILLPYKEWLISLVYVIGTPIDSASSICLWTWSLFGSLFILFRLFIFLWNFCCSLLYCAE